MKARTNIDGALSPTPAITRPRVAARLYAGATADNPMTTLPTKPIALACRPFPLRPGLHARDSHAQEYTYLLRLQQDFG